MELSGKPMSCLFVSQHYLISGTKTLCRLVIEWGTSWGGSRWKEKWEVGMKVKG